MVSKSANFSRTGLPSLRIEGSRVSFRAHRTRLLAAIDEPGALGVAFSSRLGSMTVDSYLEFMPSDTFVHTDMRHRFLDASACGAMSFAKLSSKPPGRAPASQAWRCAAIAAS